MFSATADHCRWALHRGHVLLLTINSQSTMQSLWNSWRQTGMMLHRSPSSNGPRQIAQSWSTSAAVSADDGSSPPAAEAAFRFRRGYVTRSSKVMAIDFMFFCAWSCSRASACCWSWWLFLLHKLMMTRTAAMTKRPSKQASITDGPTMMIDNAMQGLLLLLLLFIFLQKL